MCLSRMAVSWVHNNSENDSKKLYIFIRSNLKEDLKVWS